MNVSVVFGTRPEAIKMAPVILALRAAGMRCDICVTAQHRKMLDQVLEVFDIVPDVDLNLMQENQSLAGFTASALAAVDKYLKDRKPDIVLAQGDTSTVLCSALACFYNRIPFAHVEAGLRTGDMEAPWPEEANRVLTSRLAALHFAPTTTSRENLLREGVNAERVFVTGNTVIDALYLALKRVRTSPPAIPGLPGNELSSLGESSMVLITGHRRENMGNGLESICTAIKTLARQFPRTAFVFPVHLNPKVRETVFNVFGRDTSAKSSGAFPNVFLIEPLSYLPFVALMNRAQLILTDSGGIQEEAPSLGKPVLVLRDTTERPEALQTGLVELVGASSRRIVERATEILSSRPAARRILANPYGDGDAAGKIVSACTQYLSCRRVSSGP